MAYCMAQHSILFSGYCENILLPAQSEEAKLHCTALPATVAWGLECEGSGQQLTLNGGHGRPLGASGPYELWLRSISDKTHLQVDAHFFPFSIVFLLLLLLWYFSSLFPPPWVFDVIFLFICSKEPHRMENVFLFGLDLKDGTSLSW